MSEAPKGGILWLDLSTAIGWAYATKTMQAPLWGVWLLDDETNPDRSLGMRGMRAENGLLAAFKRFAPGAVGVEAPLPANRQRDANIAELLIGLKVLVEVSAKRWGIEFYCRSSGTVRSRVCGRTHRTDEEKRQNVDVKDAIVKPWIEAMGWQITDHNARDAAAGLAYEFGYNQRKGPPSGVAMFSHRPAVRLP